MQTFLPFADFHQTASVLDNSRLGNQVYREVKTLLNGGWPHHPASRMWQGYEGALCLYALALLDEMDRRLKIVVRGHGKNKRALIMPKWSINVVPRWREYYDTSLRGLLTDLPPWFGDERIHSIHRGHLLGKDPAWYGQFGWTERPLYREHGDQYWWPV